MPATLNRSVSAYATAPPGATLARVYVDPPTNSRAYAWTGSAGTYGTRYFASWGVTGLAAGRAPRPRTQGT